MRELQEETHETCDNCGERFQVTTEYPVIKAVDETGSFRAFTFCDGNCLEAWRSERSD